MIRKKTILMMRFEDTRVNLLEVTEIFSSGFVNSVKYDILQDRRVVKSGIRSKEIAAMEMRDLMFRKMVY